MADTRTYQGQTYQRSAPGEPWVLVGPSASVPGPITVGRPDPYRERGQANEDERTRIARDEAARSAAKDAAVIPYAPTIAVAERDKAVADAAKAQADAAAAVKEQAAAPDPGIARVQAALKTDSVLEALNTARSQIGEGWATGNVAGTGFFQGIPFVGQNSANLAASISGIQGSIINDTLAQLKAASANGASGYGSLTESEAQRLAAAVGALQQSQDEKSLLANLARVEKHYRNSLALLNGEDPREPTVAEKYGIPATDGDEDKALTSEGKFEADPGLAGANATIRKMILQGASASDVRDYLNRLRPGMGDQLHDIDRAVDYIRQNPGKSDGFTVDVEKKWVPNTGFKKALGDIGMTGIGAALIGAGDTASFGTLDNLTPDSEMTRAVMTGVQDESPWWYLGGQIAGGAMPALGLGRVASVAGAGARAPLVGETVFGAGYGAGSADAPDDDRAMAALLGAGGAVVGDYAGRGVARAGGRLLAGVDGVAQRALDAAGVRMTPGQILGGWAKNTEDRIAGLPFVGDAVRARRQEGVEDFNRAAFDEALAPANASTGGVIRATGIDLARQTRSDAYDTALGGVYAQADDEFQDAIPGLLARAGDVPEAFPGDIGYTLNTRLGSAFDDNGVVSGHGYQQALRGLRRDASSVENLPYGYDFGQMTREGEDVLTALLERQNPGVSDRLGTANTVNMRVETLRDAVNAARNGSRSGDVEVFMPSQLADAAARSAKKYGGTHGTTHQPFYNLTRAGQEVLPSSVPDSGTAGRLIIPALVGATAGGGSYATQEGEDAAVEGSTVSNAAIATLLAAAPYSATARTGLQRLLMAERPEIVRDAGARLLDDEIARILGTAVRPSTLGASAGAIAASD